MDEVVSSGMIGIIYGSWNDTGSQWSYQKDIAMAMW